MNKFIFSAIFMVASLYSLQAQTNPVIIDWLINATGIQGSHYVQGNSTPINDNIDANVQSVQYSNDWAYINTHGIPAYTTGPFLDGNPSLASDQSAIYRFTLNPTENTGTSTSTTGGNIGNFINGVSLFDYRDGVAWNPTTSALCGGPGNPPCPGGPMSSQDWNRDAVPAEKGGFDCAKAHPAMGNYHHHQNPSAFDLDLVTVSTICDLYASDGLYNINPNNHSPLIGFAYDGFPIYGAYAYQNADGTGAIVRMKSGYELLTNTTRANGPNVNATYFSGYFREDYQFVANTADDILDEHNGRFCITPEYPNGIYCYFTTVDANWNSAYPYVVGPTFYGNVTSGKVNNINEAVTTYVEDTTTTTTGLINKEELDFEIHIMPNPSSDFIVVQVDNLAQSDFEISLIDITGKLVKKSRLKQGSTVSYLDIQTVYAGAYIVVVSSDKGYSTRNVLIER
mgnify:FL=1